MSELYNIFPVKDASGNPATFDDGADGIPLESLLAQVNPIQDLHGYASPWGPGGGNNLVKVAVINNRVNNGITYTEDEFGTVHCSGTATAESFSANSPTSTAEVDTRCIRAIPAGTYTIANIGGARLWVQFRNSGNTENLATAINVAVGSSVTKTFSEPVIIYIRADIASGTVIDDDMQVMVTAGSTAATVYEPFANICPITGSTSLSAYRTGKNLCRVARKSATTSVGITWSEKADGTVHCVGTATSESVSAGAPNTANVDTRCLYTLPAGTYTISNIGTVRVYASFRNEANTDNLLSSRNVQAGANYTFTVSDPVIIYIRGDILTGETVDADVLCMVTAGSTAETSYEPWKMNTYSANWSTQAGEVYGGTLDVVSGVLTVGMGNLPSYNGETINEPWLSSMDAYAAGTTPTIGAQVVYPLANPIEYQLTPQQIATLRGVNNVWTDAGPVTLQYHSDAVINPKSIEGLVVDGVNLQDDAWFLKWRRLSAPAPKMDYVSVFGKDGDVDLTENETDGQVFYENRSLALDMKYIGEDWERAYSDLLNLIHGKRCFVQFSNDPYWYWSGRIIASEFDHKSRSLAMSGIMFPYKLSVAKIIKTASVDGAIEGTAETVTLPGSRMRVSPLVTVTTEDESDSVTLKWGNSTKSLSAGTYYVRGLKVGADDVTIKVWGTGTVSFEYRKGML